MSLCICILSKCDTHINVLWPIITKLFFFILVWLISILVWIFCSDSKLKQQKPNCLMWLLLGNFFFLMFFFSILMIMKYSCCHIVVFLVSLLFSFMCVITRFDLVIIYMCVCVFQKKFFKGKLNWVIISKIKLISH